MENFFLQNLHLYGFSPLCLYMCVVNFILVKNLFLQTLHTYGFFLLCICQCFIKLHSLKNIFSQQSHVYDCFMVYNRMCFIRYMLENLLLHLLHLYGFSLACVRIWLVRWLFFENLLLHNYSFLHKFLAGRLQLFNLETMRPMIEFYFGQKIFLYI